MTVFGYMSENIDRIKTEVSLGIVSTTVIRHFEMYCRYDYYKKAGYSVSNAVLFTGDDFKCNERWVYKVVKNMERKL